MAASISHVDPDVLSEFWWVLVCVIIIIEANNLY